MVYVFLAEGFEEIVLKAMQKDPSARYQTAGEMIADLEEFKKNPGIVFDYKYNSTDGTAKFASNSAAASEGEKMRFGAPVQEKADDRYEDDEYDGDDYDDEDDDDELEERRSPLIPILFAVGAALVVATVFLLLLLLSQRFGDSADDSGSSSDNSVPGVLVENGEFAMPQLVGKTWDEVKKTYEGSSLMTIVAEEEYNGEYPAGTIFEQSTIEDRMVKIGSTITVKVSKGKKKVEIQDFVGKSLDVAKRQYEKDGFKVITTSQESDEIAEGLVISTNPPAHELAEQGSTIVVVVSMGATEKMKIVPKLVGMPLQEALKRCDEYNLIPKVDRVDSSEEKDKVIEQSIKPDEKVMPNTEITLKVSTGELPQRDQEISVTLPAGISGDFEFKFYVDGSLDTSATKIINVGISAARNITYTISGANGDEKLLTVYVKCVATGKEGKYIEYRIEFEDDKCTEHKVTNNSSIFDELSAVASSSSSSETPPTPSSSSSSETTPPAPSSSSSSSETPVPSSSSEPQSTPAETPTEV